MEMLLMGVCLSIFGLAVTCLAFRAAMPAEEQPPAIQPEAVKAAAAAPRFFVQPAPETSSVYASVPIETLLLQIENHVRLEQAAAESYLADPTSVLLHSRTISPFVN